MIVEFIGIIVVLAGSIYKWYIPWLRNSETFDSRSEKITNHVENKEISFDGESFKVTQVDYVCESTTIGYKMQKYIPILRRLEGSTCITIEPQILTRSYVWSEDDIGVTFEGYLTEVQENQFPNVKIISPSFDKQSSSIQKLRLEISTINPTVILRVVEKMSKFHNYYFETYPGDERFNTPH